MHCASHRYLLFFEKELRCGRGQEDGRKTDPTHAGIMVSKREGITMGGLAALQKNLERIIPAVINGSDH